MMAYVMKPPAQFSGFDDRPVVFLSGSIEMGKAVDWQSQVTAALSDLDIIILNPRRDDWDDTWVQSIHHPKFREQVEWELLGMEGADLILTYFAPETFAPITLLELGLHIRTKKQIVCCPEGFYRKGNVDVVCRWYGVPQADTLDDLAAAARSFLTGGQKR